MMKLNRLPVWSFLFASAIITLTSCKKDVPYFNPPDLATQQNPKIIFTNNAGYHVFNGGYGSAIAAYPRNGHSNLVYLMTDRGPNVDGFGGKVFPVPDFNPQIGLFKLEGDRLEKIRVVHLKAPNGQLITGLPNPQNLGGTGEIAYTVNGAVLPLTLTDLIRKDW